MILDIDELHKRIREEKLIENLSERELKNPEGTGIDLRIGELYALSGSGFLGVEERHTSPSRLVASYDVRKLKKVVLKPGAYYVMSTVEVINASPDILVLFYPRSTLYRSGVTILSGNCSPGYRGKLTFGIANLGQKSFQLEMGARVVHAIFHHVEGKTHLYRGQWQGGRITAHKREKQV